MSVPSEFLELLSQLKIRQDEYEGLKEEQKTMAIKYMSENKVSIKKEPSKHKRESWFNMLLQSSGIPEKPRTPPMKTPDINNLKFKFLDDLPDAISNKVNIVDQEKIFEDIDQYDFGNFRDGFDIDLYKSLIFKRVTEDPTIPKDQYKSVFAFIQTWAVKFNLYGMRIKDDNYIIVSGKKVTAPKFIEFMKLKVGSSDIKEDFQHLTLSRLARCYVDHSALYAKLKGIDLPLYTQLKIENLPKHLHFLNAIYTDEGLHYKKELTELNEQFDRLIRKQGVQLAVKSYESRSIAFFHTPSALPVFVERLETETTILQDKIKIMEEELKIVQKSDQPELLREISDIKREVKDNKARIKGLTGSQSKKKGA